MVVSRFWSLAPPRVCRALETCGSVTSAKTFGFLFSRTAESYGILNIVWHSLGCKECHTLFGFYGHFAVLEKRYPKVFVTMSRLQVVEV